MHVPDPLSRKEPSRHQHIVTVELGDHVPGDKVHTELEPQAMEHMDATKSQLVNEEWRGAKLMHGTATDEA